MSHTPDSSTRQRRTVLTHLGGAAVTLLAGCTGGDSGSSTDPSQTSEPASGPLSNVAVDGTDLVVELDADEAVDRVTVIQPDGSEFDSTLIKTGVQTVSFELGTSYAPGTYRVLAVTDDESVGETSLAIQPELEIVEFGVGQNHPEKMPEELGNLAETSAYVKLANRGSGALKITQLRFEGDVPNPTPPKYPQSGIHVTNGEESAEPTLVGGSKATLYSSAAPFAFSPSFRDSCTSGGNQHTHTQNRYWVCFRDTNKSAMDWSL